MGYRGVRKTINLTAHDERVLGPFLEEGSAERDELSRMVSEEAVPCSDSGAITALARLGAKVIRDRIIERGYEDLAAAQTDEDRSVIAFSKEQAAKLWAGEV